MNELQFEETILKLNEVVYQLEQHYKRKQSGVDDLITDFYNQVNPFLNNFNHLEIVKEYTTFQNKSVEQITESIELSDYEFFSYIIKKMVGLTHEVLELVTN